MKPATAGVFTPWVLADAAVGRLSNLCWPPPSSLPSSTSSSSFLGYADPQGLKHRQALSPGISSGSPRPRVGAPQAVLLKARPVAGAVKSPSSNFTLKKLSICKAITWRRKQRVDGKVGWILSPNKSRTLHSGPRPPLRCACLHGAARGFPVIVGTSGFGPFLSPRLRKPVLTGAPSGVCVGGCHLPLPGPWPRWHFTDALR